MPVTLTYPDKTQPGYHPTLRLFSVVNLFGLSKIIVNGRGVVGTGGLCHCQFASDLSFTEFINGGSGTIRGVFGNVREPTSGPMRLRPEPAEGLDGRFESDLPPFRKEVEDEKT